MPGRGSHIHIVSVSLLRGRRGPRANPLSATPPAVVPAPSSPWFDSNFNN